MVTKRLVMRELLNFREDRTVVGIQLWDDESDLRHLTAAILGPPSTPYEYGVFNIDIYLPDLYPFVPPVIKFITKVWHPNIGSRNGIVSLNALKGEWTAAMNLTTTLISLQALLAAPEPGDPQDDVVAIQYLNDYPKFAKKAKRWTTIYANVHNNNDQASPSQHNTQDNNHPPPPTQHNGQDDNADNAPPPQQQRRIARAPLRLNDYMF